MVKKTNGQVADREELPKEIRQPEITPEAIEADKRARCEAAKGEFQELCQKHRVTFVPIFQVMGTTISTDFAIVAQ